MAEVLEEKGPAGGKDDYTADGTVDLKGRPVLRSKTGRWRACSFIVGQLNLYAYMIYSTVLCISTFPEFILLAVYFSFFLLYIFLVEFWGGFELFLHLFPLGHELCGVCRL
jgi:hypothetical protein